ncbi:hypothetical protein DFH07DRAFT_949332 [Mycena maculata]|uniref:Uncharacterized protein n=1 Tax=Mycena maculata TaxID=230809 RepID=A0AAD7KDI1_9AGAR|nr:hypothetical protein DFH07DRAFT_949332 [Mycena maculata]
MIDVELGRGVVFREGRQKEKRRARKTELKLSQVQPAAVPRIRAERGRTWAAVRSGASWVWARYAFAHIDTPLVFPDPSNYSFSSSVLPLHLSRGWITPSLRLQLRSALPSPTNKSRRTIPSFIHYPRTTPHIHMYMLPGRQAPSLSPDSEVLHTLVGLGGSRGVARRERRWSADRHLSNAPLMHARSSGSERGGSWAGRIANASIPASLSFCLRRQWRAKW